MESFRCKINKRSNKPNQLRYPETSPLCRLAISLVIVLVTGSAIFTVMLLAGRLIFAPDLSIAEAIPSAPGPHELAYLKYSIIAQDLSFFIVPSVIIIALIVPGYWDTIQNVRRMRGTDVLLVILLALCVFPLTSFTAQINSRMELPGWLSGMEQWMRSKENYAADMIDTVMTGESIGGVLMSIIILSVLPAVSEELIFRGVFQRMLKEVFRSDHLAVFITSFVFSTIHIQFYGFIPRFILGLIFGYLFLWSGSLWMPVIAHFVNNAVPVAGAAVKGWETVNSFNGTDLVKQIPGVISSLILVILIMIYFKRGAGTYNNLNT